MSLESESSPDELKETLSEKNTISFDESTTIRGSASIYSIVGHDDPTAVMGNTAEMSSHRKNRSATRHSDATISSFVSRDDDEEESREPFEGLKDSSAHLREQLAELDQAANGWNESRRSESGSGREGASSDIESFYVNEAGAGKAKTGNNKKKTNRMVGVKPRQPETIFEEQDATDLSEEGDEEIDSEARDQLMPIAGAALGLHLQSSRDTSRASGYVSSDNSLTSTEHHSSILSTISIESHPEEQEASKALTPVQTDGSSNHTNEVVRGVQEMLRAVEQSVVPTSPGVVQKEKEVLVEIEDALSTARSSKLDGLAKYQLQAYIPVVDERGVSLDDEEGNQQENTDRVFYSSSEGTKSSFGETAQCILLPLCCLATIIAVVIGFLLAFSVIGNSSSLTVFSKGSGDSTSTTGQSSDRSLPPMVRATSAPAATTSSSPLNSPTIVPEAPVLWPGDGSLLSPPPTVNNLDSLPSPIAVDHPSQEKEETRIPGSSPEGPPAPSPSNNQVPSPAPQTSTFDSLPIVSDTPVSIGDPTQGVDELEAPGSSPLAPPSSTSDRAPVDAPMDGENSGLIVTNARTHLESMSGNALNDPTTPQYAAYQWLLNEDPANLDLDALSAKDLEQRYISALLYFSMDGNSWFDSYGFLGQGDICTWQDQASGKGISCNAEGAIEDVSISQNGLRGSIPIELKKLTALKGLEFRANRIAGSVPSELGNLSDLEVLDLRQNRFTGSFPSSIFELPKLKRLFMLRNADLLGTIPQSIEKASSLEMISFQRCKLAGSIPSGIGNLSNLYFLTFLGNQMTGTLPSGLTQLPKLEVLELAGNQLTGPVPDFAGQPLLYFVSLFENQFSSSLPDSLGDLPGLLFFDVRDNQLTGPIPSTFNDIPELVTFYASGNQLTGPLPSFSGNVGLLQSVDVSRNKISGNVGALFVDGGPVGEWHTIDLSSNLLTGSIPKEIGQYTRLATLVLADNRLSSSIPREIATLRKLNTLDLSINRLTGTVPEEISRLEGLMRLNLSSNLLGGTITDTLGTLTNMSILDLSNNELVGTVPEALEALTGLDALFLQQNSLTGNLDPILCPVGTGADFIGTLSSDCGGINPDVTCSCCTSCCDDTSGCLSQ